MRFRLMATYRGVPYEVGVGPSSSDVVLFAACPPPEELGFEPAPGHWRKQVIRAEVNVLWESRPVGTFHGDPCLVLDDLGDRLHIAYLGKDGRRARELGYWQVDRGVYELLTPRDEVTGLTEEKVEKSLRRRPPVNESQPMPSYPYGSPQRPPAPGASAGLPDPRGVDGYASDPALAPAGAWNRNGTQADTGSWHRNAAPPSVAGANGHGMASWNGMAGADGILNAPTAPGPGRRRQGPKPGRRSARKQRVPTRAIFSELADLAAIPRSAYALEQESDGAMCLLRTEEGFEVFSAADGARHEVRAFDDEEAAYFYLFGVLAAEAVRNGSLIPPR